jgi:nucleoside-diphosphate-sugar epimerase
MSLRDKRVLLTGGAGFIGSHLCRRLVDEGAKVFVVVKYNSVIENVRLVRLWDAITPVEADVRNLNSLSQLQDIRPQIIFHLAAYNHVGDSFLHFSEAMTSNSQGTVNLLEAYEDYDRFVYTSTSEVYGHQEEVPFREQATPFPLSPYAVGKYSGELYARLKQRSLGRPIVVLRPFNAFGPYQSARAVIAELIIKCLRGEDVVTTEGKQTRDFNFVENLIDGFVLAATRPEAVGEVINVGSGIDTPIREVVERIHRLTGSQSRLRIGEWPYRPGEIWQMRADSEKAARLLGWSPRVDLETGLKRTIDWYRSYLREFSDPASPLARLAL